MKITQGPNTKSNQLQEDFGDEIKILEVRIEAMKFVLKQDGEEPMKAFIARFSQSSNIGAIVFVAKVELIKIHMSESMYPMTTSVHSGVAAADKSVQYDESVTHMHECMAATPGNSKSMLSGSIIGTTAR